MKNKYLIFDFCGTLVKMRPAKLLLPKSKLVKLSKFYKLSIITGAKRSETLNILNKLKIINLFCKIITKDDSIYRKPDARLFNLINDKEKILLYVGDSSNDAKMVLGTNISYLDIKDFKTL